MIVRYSLACGTCGNPHTVRIGMGHESTQRHRFACRGCGEDIEVGLNIDFKNISCRVVLGENAVDREEVPQASIVNLDANFLVPADMQGVDSMFSRLPQVMALFKASEDALTAMGLPKPSPQDSTQIQPARPDFAAEWKHLRTAWSLVRNNQMNLALQRIENAAIDLYPEDPIESIQDWVWRIAMRITQPAYEPLFRDAAKAMQQALRSPQAQQLVARYNTAMSAERGNRYFDLMKSYFSLYDDFAQVQFIITGGIAPGEKYQATSSNFDAVRMFYGNAFEVFASQVDLLAFLNNLSAGRAFDHFEKMTADEYLKLDKSSRFNPFSNNKPFAALCTEADNQLRNASHHGGFTFDRTSQVIRYRAGKGGTGEERQLSYTEYLIRCVRIFMQSMTILRLELILSNNANIRPPI